MRHPQWFVLLFLLAAVPAEAQTRTDVFPGKVEIRSVAVDALKVLGSIVTATIEVVDASVGSAPIVLTLKRSGASSSATSRRVALAFSDNANTTLTAAIAGVRPDSVANYNGDLAFYTANGGAGTPATTMANMSERMRIVAGGSVGIGTLVPTYGLNVAAGTISAEGAAVTSPVGLSINGISSSPDWAQIVFGDGSGYRLNFGTRSAGNFASRLQIYDNGSVRFPTGSASAPSLSFLSESTSGLYLDGSGYPALTAKTVQVLKTSGSGLEVPAKAGGTGSNPGQSVYIGRNTSGGGASGYLGLETKTGGTVVYVWADTTGVVRGNASPPTEATGDTIGTVIGTQTSTWESKDILSRETNTRAALAELLRTPVYRFTYKSGSFNGEEFTGITTRTSPKFGMDAGKSFNPVTSFGVTVLAIQELEKRVRALEARR